MISFIFSRIIFILFNYRDPFGDGSDNEKNVGAPVKIDVDLSLTAFENAKRYRDVYS